MSEGKRKARPKVRGNGMGCAYQRPGQKTWTVEVVVGWKMPADPSKPKRPVRRKKSGFRSKKEALDYASELQLRGNKRVRMSMEALYKSWKESYSPRVGNSTMVCYESAYKHFKPLHGAYMDMISPEDLQKCMDDCPSGKRTHENMRCIAGLLWGYAIDMNIVDRDITKNLYTGKGQSVQRDAITPEEENKIKAVIGKERYAEYIYCLCNLGFRPGEMLELRKDQLFCAPVKLDSGETENIWYFVNGKKTDAGRDRVVIVPPVILPIILDRLFIPGTDLVFPMYSFTKEKKPKFKYFKPMTHAYFREEVFKPMMARLGIAEGKVPYCGRHSYADKLKNAPGSDKDKASLIGHSDYAFTKDKYQSTHLKDLLLIVNGFGS